MTTTKQVTKLRIQYRSLTNPPSRNQDPQECVALRFNYVNTKSPSELTYGELKKDLVKELAKRLGRPNANFASYFTTEDEIEIDASDDQVVSHVLQSNHLHERLDDVVIVYEPKVLNRRLYSTLDTNEPLCLFEVADDAGVKKIAIVGITQHGKLFIRYANAGTVQRLVFFTVSQLGQVLAQLKSDLQNDATLDHASLDAAVLTSEDEYYANLDVNVAKSKTLPTVEWTISTQFILTRSGARAKNDIHALLTVKIGTKVQHMVVPLKWNEFRVVRGGASIEVTSLEKLSESLVPVEPPANVEQLVYKIRQSSKYNTDSIANTYEALQNEDGQNGVATNSDYRAYLQATFENPHTVTSVTVRPLLQSGWGATYLSGANLVYSQDEINWKNAIQLNGISESASTFNVPNISAPYWRIRKDGNGYLSIGYLKFMGVPSTDPIPEVSGKPLQYYKDLADNLVSTSEGTELVSVPRPNCQKYQDAGDSSFNLLVSEDEQEKLNTLVEATQDSFAREGKFNNYFKVPLTVVNKSSELLSFVKVEMSYKNHSGEWVPLKNVKLGARYTGYRGGYEYSFFDSPVANFKAGQADTLVFMGSVEVTGTPGETFQTRNRAHHSLPQPLVIKTAIIDSENKVREISVEQGNKPLSLSNVESFAKDNTLDISKVRYVTCDNTESLERVYAAVYLNTAERYLYLRADGTSTGYAYDHLVNFMNDAKKNAKEEIEMESIGNEKRHIYLKFDPASDYAVYAARIVLKSETNKVDKHVFIKDLVDELAKL